MIGSGPIELPMGASEGPIPSEGNSLFMICSLGYSPRFSVSVRYCSFWLP